MANSSTPLSNVLPQTVNTAPLIPQWSGVNQQTSQLLLQILSQVGINIPAQPTSPIDPKQPVMATPQAVTTGPVEIKKPSGNDRGKYSEQPGNPIQPRGHRALLFQLP